MWSGWSYLSQLPKPRLDEEATQTSFGWHRCPIRRVWMPTLRHEKGRCTNQSKRVWTTCQAERGYGCDGQWGRESVGESPRLGLWGGKSQRRSVAAAVPPINTPSCTVSSNQNGGKLVPDSQFKFFTCYHHLKVSKLDDLVVDLLRFNGITPFRTKGG